MGRRRLPPDEMRWFATSGIMVTSDPVRDRIIALTRSISEATRETSFSMLAFGWGGFSSKGTTTPTLQTRVADRIGREEYDTPWHGSFRAAHRKPAAEERESPAPMVEIVRT